MKLPKLISINFVITAIVDKQQTICVSGYLYNVAAAADELALWDSFVDYDPAFNTDDCTIQLHNVNGLKVASS